MRDPARIAPLLAALGDYWRAHPDMRLGQIVCAAAWEESVGLDLWPVEDDVIAKGLRHLSRRAAESST